MKNCHARTLNKTKSLQAKTTINILEKPDIKRLKSISKPPSHTWKTKKQWQKNSMLKKNYQSMIY